MGGARPTRGGPLVHLTDALRPWYPHALPLKRPPGRQSDKTGQNPSPDGNCARDESDE